MRQMSTFASKRERFSADLPNSQQSTTDQEIGPGTYHKSAPWVNTKKQNPKASSEPRQTVLPNAPSIPSHENVFGYEKNEKGELIKQTSRQEGLTGKGDDTAGPGHYDVE